MIFFCGGCETKIKSPDWTWERGCRKKGCEDVLCVTKYGTEKGYAGTAKEPASKGPAGPLKEPQQPHGQAAKAQAEAATPADRVDLQRPLPPTRGDHSTSTVEKENNSPCGVAMLRWDGQEVARHQKQA